MGLARKRPLPQHVVVTGAKYIPRLTYLRTKFRRTTLTLENGSGTLCVEEIDCWFRVGLQRVLTEDMERTIIDCATTKSTGRWNHDEQRV